jgi:preprotein translocase subunit YajC
MPAYLFILVLLAIVWFFLIRPRQRQMRAQQQQMASLQVGDEIVTAGGLYGTVKAVEDDEVRLEVAPDVVVRIAKRAVAAVLTENAPDELETGEPAEEGDGTLPSA